MMKMKKKKKEKHNSHDIKKSTIVATKRKEKLNNKIAHFLIQFPSSMGNVGLNVWRL